jgi:cathepsin A (carboxypeptidase C)
VGVAIGNGWVDPFYQYPAYNTFAYEKNLITGPRSFLVGAGLNIC